MNEPQSDTYFERQFNRLLDRIDRLSDQFAKDLRELDERYPSKSELTNLTALLMERQTGWERQMDVKIVGLDDEMKAMRDDATDSRRAARNALYAAVGTVAATVIGGVVIAMMSMH